MNAIETERIFQAVLAHYPTVQAVYHFGSYGTGDDWPTSDVDLARLFPHGVATQPGALSLSAARVDLERLPARDVDLTNLCQVSTVFQSQIVTTGRCIDCADAYAAEESEMLVLSKYQRLNQERTEILAEDLRTGSFYDVWTKSS